MTGVYPLYDILDAITYNAANGKPLIFELIPQARNKKFKSDRKTLLRDLERLLYNARVIVYDPVGLIRQALGMVKGKEDDTSSDTYDVVIQALTYADAKDIFNDIRNGLNAYLTANPSAIYNDFLYEEIVQEAGLGDFVYRYSIKGTIAGKSVEVPA